MVNFPTTFYRLWKKSLNASFYNIKLLSVLRSKSTFLLIHTTQWYSAPNVMPPAWFKNVFCFKVSLLGLKNGFFVVSDLSHTYLHTLFFYTQLVIRKRLRDSSVIVPLYDSRYVIWLSFPRKMGIPLNWWIKYSVTWRKYVVKFLLSIILWLLIAGCTKQTWVSNIRSKMEKCKFKDLFSIHVLCHHIFRHFRLCLFSVLKIPKQN